MEVPGVASDPKFHEKKMPEVPLFVNETESSSHAGAVVVKSATGFVLIVIFCDVVAAQLPSEIVKVTVLLPPVLYKTPEGFSAVDD